MKVYIVNYSVLGSGSLEILANNKSEAEELVSNMSYEEIKDDVCFDDGLSIDYIEDEDGNCFELGDE